MGVGPGQPMWVQARRSHIGPGQVPWIRRSSHVPVPARQLARPRAARTGKVEVLGDEHQNIKT